MPLDCWRMLYVFRIQMMFQQTFASIKTLAFYILHNNREPLFLKTLEFYILNKYRESISLSLSLQKAANLKLKHRSALEEEQQRAERAERRKKRRERREREREEEQHEPPEDEMTETAMSKHGRGAPPAFRICVALTLLTCALLIVRSKAYR